MGLQVSSMSEVQRARRVRGRDGDAGDNVDVERRGIRVKGTDIGVGFARIVHVQTAGATGDE